MEKAKSQRQPFIEMVKTDAASITQQPDSEPLPFMETVVIEVDSPQERSRSGTGRELAVTYRVG
jgi:hypothetical protein